MELEPAQISFSVEPGQCAVRLAGALGVANAEELHRLAGELCAYRKDVVVDWSEATQLDASIAQVLLCLRAGLQEQDKSLSGRAVPPAIQTWLQTAGLAAILGEVTAGK